MEQHKDSETILSSIVMEKALPKVLATPVQIHGRNLISRGVESKGQAKCARSDNAVSQDLGILKDLWSWRGGC
jgi:hypothetical protein